MVSLPGLENGSTIAVSQTMGKLLSCHIQFIRLIIKFFVFEETCFNIAYGMSSSPGAVSPQLANADSNSFTVKGLLYDSCFLVEKSRSLSSSLNLLLKPGELSDFLEIFAKCSAKAFPTSLASVTQEPFIFITGG